MRKYVFSCGCIVPTDDDNRVKRLVNTVLCKEHNARLSAVSYQCEMCGQWRDADPGAIGRTKLCPECRPPKNDHPKRNTVYDTIKINEVNWVLTDKAEYPLTAVAHINETVTTTAGPVRYEDWCRIEAERIAKAKGRVAEVVRLAHDRCYVRGNRWQIVDEHNKRYVPKIVV